jgi:hypothetical protein
MRNDDQKSPLVTLTEVLDNVQNPTRWATSEGLVEAIRTRPSLRGMTYGYIAELEFAKYLKEELGITDQTVDDDHKKTKSDITFVFNGKTYTSQVKCLQTTLIKEVKPGFFSAVVQNDASDRRTVTLPNGERIQTTCYVAGEYDILVTTVQPFVGRWKFIFKKNKDLTRSTYRKYTLEQRSYLLATSEKVPYPNYADAGWSEDLLILLADPELGSSI